MITLLILKGLIRLSKNYIRTTKIFSEKWTDLEKRLSDNLLPFNPC